MNSLSLTVYETRPTGDNIFMDILFGASAIKTNLINNSGSVSTMEKEMDNKYLLRLNLENLYKRKN